MVNNSHSETIARRTADDEQRLSEDESTAIEKICEEDVIQYGEHDAMAIISLYRRGLVYFNVPVFPDDHFQVSTLEGFVSNMEQSYEDPTEELLYAVFITSSEHATIAQLAATLQADLPRLEATGGSQHTCTTSTKAFQCMSQAECMVCKVLELALKLSSINYTQVFTHLQNTGVSKLPSFIKCYRVPEQQRQ